MKVILLTVFPKHFHCYLLLLCKLAKKTVSPQVKNYDNFSCAFALFSTMNEWQHVLILKYGLGPLLLDSLLRSIV